MEKINISEVKFEIYDPNQIKNETINNFTLENVKNHKNILNEDPLVFTIDNFVSNDECDHFIKLASPNMKQALVSSNQKGETGIVSNGRTGSNCWIKHDNDKITYNVGQRIANYIGVPLINAEQYQVIHYDVSQEYRQHHDSWEHDESAKAIRCMKYGGQRLFTALVYLNDVEEGGGTCLTRLNINVKATKGRLLFFENVHKNTNKKHILSEHAGMPVLKGEKWAFNLWFREKPRTEIVYDPKPSIKANEIVDLDNKDLKNELLTNETIVSKNIINEFNNNTEVNREIKRKFITDDELINLDNICKTINFKKNDSNIISREESWVSITELSDFVKRISEVTGIDESHFENINVVKYFANKKRCPHFDAYDFSIKGNEQRKKTKGLEGQRIITITGSLSNMIEYKFPETSNYVEVNRGDLLIYKNTIKDTNIRDPKMKKSIENRSNNDGIIFNIYVREKNKDGKLIKGITQLFESNSVNKEIIQNIKDLQINENIQQNENIILKENEEINEVLINAYSSVKEKKHYKSFTFCNKVNWNSVLNTVEKLKMTRDPVYGIINKDILNININFDEFTPAIVNNIIKPESLQILQSYIHEGIKNNEFSLGDRQSNRYKARDETVTRFLHYELVPIIRHLTKKPVKPTYTYLACYTKNADLPAHTDQADCEYTVSFIIDKPENSYWPIYFDKTKQPIKNKGRYPFTPDKETCIPCDCKSGGLMMFNGTDHIHFREPCEFDYYNIVLLHYRV